MELMRILHKNYWKSGTILSSTNDNPQFPSEDTQNETKQTFWRTKATYIASQVIILDALAPVECNMIALLNHNLTSGADIDLQGGTDPGVTAGLSAVEHVTHYGTNLFFFFAGGSITKRYWKLTITDYAPNTYLQVGPIILGKYWTVSENFNYLYGRGVEDYSEVQFTDSRVVSAAVKAKPEGFTLPFRMLTDGSALNVRELIKEVGVHSPFVICFDYNYPNTNSYWMMLKNLDKPKCKSPDVWEWDADIEEAF